MLLDITRLIGRAHRAGPSGIDRIELEYARHFLFADAPARPAYPVIHMMGRLFGVNPDCARRFVRKVTARWHGDDGAAEAGPRGGRAGLFGLYASLLGGHWMAGWQLRRRLARHARPPVYLVVSHHHLAAEPRLERIRRRYGARCVAFLHDLIPIDYPEYVERRTADRHLRLLGTLTRQVEAVIVNSRTTAGHFRHYLERNADSAVCRSDIHVALPGVRPFPQTARARAAAAVLAPGPVPYFVIVGTIEPKKNHLLLLNLWSQLATTVARPPRLLVVGARGWEYAQVVEMLERSSRLHGLVTEHNALDDATIGALLQGARAVLLPSFVEGFGLPLAESLASGVPVICSDIPAFREIGGDVPEFLGPLDVNAWRDAILDYSRSDSARRAAQLARLRDWRMPDWPAHFAVVEQALDRAAGAAPVPS